MRAGNLQGFLHICDSLLLAALPVVGHAQMDQRVGLALFVADILRQRETRLRRLHAAREVAQVVVEAG